MFIYTHNSNLHKNRSVPRRNAQFTLVYTT